MICSSSRSPYREAKIIYHQIFGVVLAVANPVARHRCNPRTSQLWVLMKSSSSPDYLLHREAWHAPLKSQDFIRKSLGVLTRTFLCNGRILGQSRH